MFVSSLREFPENYVYRQGGFNYFIEYLHRKLFTTNFSRMILKVLKKTCFYWICIFKQQFSCSITIFMYIILAKMTKHFGTMYKSVISSVEVYDKHIITCHFSHHTLYQSSFIYHPLSISALGLIS